MRVQAEPGEREFAHVGTSDDHAARTPQPRHGDGVGFGRQRVSQYTRAGACHLAFDVEEVLDRHGNACQRRKHRAGTAQCVVGVGGGAGTLCIDVQEGDRSLSRRVCNALERLLHQLAAGGFAVA